MREVPDQGVREIQGEEENVMGCSDGQVWSDTCQCCVDPQVQSGIESLYAVASRVHFVAIDRVFDHRTKDAMLKQIESSKRILNHVLATLNEGRPYQSATSRSSPESETSA